MFSELKSPKMVAMSKPMEPSGIYDTMENVIKDMNARWSGSGPLFSLFFPSAFFSGLFSFFSFSLCLGFFGFTYTVKVFFTCQRLAQAPAAGRFFF